VTFTFTIIYVKSETMTIDRRTILKRGAALTAASFAVLADVPVWAKAGLQLGSKTIDVVSDGRLTLPGRFVFADMPEGELQSILEKYGVPKDQVMPDCNLTLVRDGDRTILFDVGAGPNFMPSAGKLSEALETLDVDPTDITDMVFTHAHPDHLWGVLDDFDEPLFPEARHLIGQAEWEYWMDPATVDTIGEARQAFAAGAMRNLKAIEDMAIFFKPGDEVLPGIEAHATYGHTPGHTSFEIRSGTESVMVIGDAITNHHVAFEKPGWEANSDQDRSMGAKTRTMLLDQLAAEKMKLIGFHLPYPGIGYAEKKDGAYRFVAA